VGVFLKGKTIQQQQEEELKTFPPPLFGSNPALINFPKHE
jgi:hypothetical protein